MNRETPHLRHQRCHERLLASKRAGIKRFSFGDSAQMKSDDVKEGLGGEKQRERERYAIRAARDKCRVSPLHSGCVR